ncbi:WD40-repeat-containing domain protein [Syncephalis fuscata]|nr:WD40-repeat-containing domain protein [Syncephalis fuscata]
MTTGPTFQVGHAPELLANTPYPLQHSCTIAATTGEPAYIYDIHDMGEQTLAVTTSADHDIRMQRVQGTDHLLLSCGEDGLVALWDFRQNTKMPSQSYQSNICTPMLALDQADTIIAAGTDLVEYDAYVLFWDMRSNSLVKQFSEAHSDSVTQVHFHPDNAQYLLTASMDGMLNIYDLQEQEEDDVLIASANTESSIHRADFFGPSFEYIYCLSHMETLSLWKGEGMDPLCLFGDIRRASTDTTTIDYAINCQYDASSQRLFMLSGSNEGALHIHHVNLNELQHCTSFMSGGHSEIIRGSYWQPKSNYLVSGGEDGKLCSWSSNNTANNSNIDTTTAHRTAMRSNGQHKQPRQRFTPYQRRQ